jgi:Ca2+-binding EF-hand superfamily protein
LERELETSKIELALKPDFNLLDAFKIFDTRGSGNVSVQDIIMALRDNIGFDQFTHDDVYLLFRRNDHNQDGKLNFTEFSNLMMPVSKEYAALLTDRPDIYMSRGVPPSQFFNFDTRQELRNIWTALFKCERSCEVLRNGLRARPYFNLKAAFSYLDRSGQGQVSLDDLREFLSNNGFFATERELQGVMIKCDKNGNGRISFNEFIDEFQPKLG